MKGKWISVPRLRGSRRSAEGVPTAREQVTVNLTFSEQRVEEAFERLSVLYSNEENETDFFLIKAWKAYWRTKEYGEWLSGMKKGWKNPKGSPDPSNVSLAASTTIWVLSVVWYPIHSFLLSILPISLKLLSSISLLCAVGTWCCIGAHAHTTRVCWRADVYLSNSVPN